MLFRLEPQLLIILAFCLMFALSFHEYAHAYVADKCGDATARMAGRLSVNPLAHLDLFGTLMVLVVGFGYAKPVPVDPRNFRFRNADAYVAAAGPAMNFLLGILGGVMANVSGIAGLMQAGSFPLDQLIYLFMLINFNLCLFNLIPLGPLDGSYVLPNLLPPLWRQRYQYWNIRYGAQTLFGLVLLSFMLPGFSIFSWIPLLSRKLMFVIL